MRRRQWAPCPVPSHPQAHLLWARGHAEGPSDRGIWKLSGPAGSPYPKPIPSPAP